MATAVCANCNGTGWRIVERHEVSGAERCTCLSGTRVERLEQNANIPPLYENASFDNFVLPRDNQMAHRELMEVLIAVKGFAREFPAGKKDGLLLVGEPGTGKTHLAAATLRLLLARGHEGLFFDYQNLLDRIRAGFSSGSGIIDKEAYRIALDTEVLLLDDLGAHRVTEWVEDTVTAIITHRCNHRKATIVTTNLRDQDSGETGQRRTASGEKIDYKITLTDRIGERARSRLFEMCRVVKMPLIEDYRLRKIAHR